MRMRYVSKKRGFLLLLVMLVLSVSHRVSAQTGWQVYADEEYGFSIRHPTQWVALPENTHAPNLPDDALSFSSEQGIFDLTIICMENDLGLSLIDAASRAFVGHFGPFEQMQLQELLINGMPAVRMIHAQPEIEGSRVRYISTFFQKDRAVYWVFTQFASKPESGEPVSLDHDIRIALYEKAVSTFTLLPPPRQTPVRLSTLAVPPNPAETLTPSESLISTFVWPSTGYLGYLYGQNEHLAIDVWTNTSGTGNDGSQGNPIYSVADGSVYTIFDDGDGVPMVVGIQHSSLGLWTWYWHMADEYSPVSYIDPNLYVGQPVTSQTFLGYQGNRRWQGLYDVIVHLHFGVSDVPYSQNQYGLDPSPYFDLALNWNDPDHLPWMYYIERPGGCCGCLPASCCSGAAAQASDPESAFRWDEPDISSTTTTMPCTASKTCGMVDTSEPTPLPVEGKESAATDGPVSGDIEPSITTTTPLTEPTTASYEDVDPIDSPTPTEMPAQRTSIEPQRTPPASASYRIPRSVFGSGGGVKTSTHYVMNSTQGQSTDLSRRTSASYVLAPGYWSRWTPSSAEYYRVHLPLVIRNH